MGPRSPSPLSDGRYSRSEDGEKVTKNTHRITHTHVDPSARPTTSSSRPSRPVGLQALMYDKDAHFNGYGRDRSRSPYRRDRSRSRSPYRADKDPARDKRRRQEDHYGMDASDHRRPKVYDDNQYGRGQSYNGYRDFDSRPPQAGGRYPKNYNHDNYYNNHSNNQRGRGRANSRGSYGNRDRDRSRSPYRAPPSDSSRPGSRQGPISPAYTASDGGFNRRGSTSSTQRESTPQAPQPTAAPQNAARASEQVEGPEPEKQLSDAELIEERRKKRDAIRKKHAASSANDSLLRSTLEGNLPSSAATPQTESPSASQAQSPTSPSPAASPGTPGDSASAPASPAELAAINDEDLIKPVQVNAGMEDQGQAAADYDPTQDMHEDRPEFKQRQIQEAQAKDHSNATAPAKNGALDIDMFAEDDGDMFATDDGPGQQAGVVQARALDESLLDNWDYPDGHYRIINGELLHGRYAIEQQVGKGTFATVVRATDTNTGTKVAIKIACRNDTMLKAGQKEMRFLERLNEKDPDDKRFIIRLLNHFMHKGHLCLVFENMKADLRELLKMHGRDQGFVVEGVQIYAYQMFHALLHLKNAEVLHADLKPDNILVNEKQTCIKVCDFGTATLQQDAELTPYLVSRFYRAPEVILGIDFDYGIDMWAVGCTLYELYTGRILFMGKDNNDMLRVIQECRGKIPIRLIKRAKLADKHFDGDGIFHRFEENKMTHAVVPKPMHFAQSGTGKDLKSRLGGNLSNMTKAKVELHNSFVDLLDKCLQLDPAKRIQPRDALRHRFFGPPTSAKPKTAVPSTVFRPVSARRAG